MVISIQSAIRSVDDREALITTLLDTYRASLQDQKQYVVELDPPLTEAVRKSLETAIAKLGDPRSGHDLAETRSLVRGILRDYQQDGERFLIALREKLQEHAAALEQVVNSMSTEGDESQEELNRQLDVLDRLTDCRDLEAMRRQVLAAEDALRRCVERVARQNRFLIAQFQAEIQVLHRRVDSLAQRSDGMRIGGRDIQAVVESRIASGSGFSLVMVSLRNLPALAAASGQSIAERTAHACLKRLANLLSPGEPVGAWSAGMLAGVISNEANTFDLTKLISSRLAGKYVFTVDAQRQEVVLQVGTAVVQHRPEEGPAALHRRIEEVLRMFGN